MASTQRNPACAGRRNAAVVLVLGLLAVDARATEPRPTDAFTSLFEQTCVRHREAPQALAEQLTQWGAAELPAGEARPYLGDGEGTAWALPRQQVRYVVTLQRGGGICTVLAPRAEAKAVQRNFPLLALDSPAPFTAHRIEAAAAASSRESTQQVVYAWTAPAAAWEWRLTLTLSTDRKRAMPATASMARVAATP